MPAVSDPTELTRFAYRVPAAAKLIGVSEAMMWKLIREGRVTARRIGRCTLIKREDLLALMEGAAP